MNAEEIGKQIPAGNLWMTLRDMDGNDIVTGVPILPVQVVDYEGGAAAHVIFDNGSDRESYWPVESVEHRGPQTVLVGSKGEALFSRRQEED